MCQIIFVQTTELIPFEFAVYIQSVSSQSSDFSQSENPGGDNHGQIIEVIMKAILLINT